MRHIKTISLFLALCATALAQNSGGLHQEAIEQKFRAFDYDAVIELADQALIHADDYVPEILFQLYEMKAVAHYSKMEMTEALNSFIAILKLDPQHELDPIKYSPKIIDFYESIKLNIKSEPVMEEQAIEASTTVDTVIVYRSDASLKKRMIPSLLIPGSAQWLGGQKTKGVALTAASTALLSTSIYFSFDCARKENDYLNAKSQSAIDDAYASYNSSYKTRNILWTAYSLVWLYSQIDLLFFQKPDAPLKVGLIAPVDYHFCVGLALHANF